MLLVKILTANDRYSVPDCDNLLTLIQTQWSHKLRISTDFFCSFSGNYIKFWTFIKKRGSSYLLYFGNYRLSMTWLDHSLKNTVWEHPLTVNILRVPKLLQNVHERTFIIFFITLREPGLEYTSLSDILNLRVAW